MGTEKLGYGHLYLINMQLFRQKRFNQDSVHQGC